MKKRFCFILLLMSCSISLCFMSSTYSRYVADTTSNIDILFAKWQILVNSTDVTSGNSSQISFVPTIENNDYVADGTIAPTSKGYFDIIINPVNVDVSFSYTVNLDIDNEDIPDLMITKYAILNSDYVDGDDIEYLSLNNGMITNDLIFDNSIDNFSFEEFTIRVYFEWYDGSDEVMNDSDDSTIGNLAANDDISFTINADINFEQIINEENLGD